MVGEVSVTKIDEATMTKSDEAEAVKADERTTSVDIGKMAAEMASTLPQTKDHPWGHGGEREVHTISSNEPPRPHGIGVMDAELFSTTKMAALGASEEPKVEGNLALTRIDPWAILVPVPLGGPEEEDVHCRGESLFIFIKSFPLPLSFHRRP
jgi:hypothetical protein